MWDFGGQEIYHSTHRLFVSRGSVFVVVWNPDQEEGKPDPEGEYHDTWYPVRYWLDYIHAECPHNRPVIAIVCSHQGKRWKAGDADADNEANAALKRELEARLRTDIGDEYANRIPLYVFDAEDGIGEREDLERWLCENVLQVVETQGTVVPSYWEIAQDMVEDWLPAPKRDASQRSTHKLTEEKARLTLDEFSDELRRSIADELDKPDADLKYAQLQEHWDGGRFLTPHRVERTLRFLTHSGWLYWDKELTDSRVIIDQPWALQTIYTTLQRDHTAAIYGELVSHQGRFTFEQLQAWCWQGSDKLDDSDQQLILSFMVSVGVVFPISDRYWREKRTYISPNHLPDIDLAGKFRFDETGQEEIVTSKHLHRGHWFSILRELCKRYGQDGSYARNECVVHGSTYLPDREHKPWSVLLHFELDDEKRGLGGKIRLRARGAELGDRLASMKRFVESFMPGFAGQASDAAAEFDRACHGPIEDGGKIEQRKETVFFSYAWDPEDKKGFYEEAVDAVYSGLLRDAEQQRLVLMRDKKTLDPGDYISEYVVKAGS
jgi:internalin A